MPEPTHSPAALAIHSMLRVREAQLASLARTRTTCKVVSISLVILFFVMTRTGPTPSFWLLLPLALIVLLDVTSLAAERLVRKSLQSFLGDLQSTNPDRLKSLDLSGMGAKPAISAASIESFCWSILSPSVWLFYGLLAVLTSRVPTLALPVARPFSTPPGYSPLHPTLSSGGPSSPQTARPNAKLPTAVPAQPSRPGGQPTPFGRPPSTAPVPTPVGTKPTSGALLPGSSPAGSPKAPSGPSERPATATVPIANPAPTAPPAPPAKPADRAE